MPPVAARTAVRPLPNGQQGAFCGPAICSRLAPSLRTDETMRVVLVALCTLLIAGGATGADRIYRWTMPDGKVQFGDTPPSSARDIRNFDRKVGTTAPANQAQTEAPQTPQISETDCINKRAQLNTYKNAARLVERDSLGREREFTVAEREMLVKKVQTDLESQCGDAPPE